MFQPDKAPGEVALPSRENLPALDEIGRILLRAADILETGGHCKGRANFGDAHCLSGAITQATFTIQEYPWDGHSPAIDRVADSLGGECPIKWNDAPERTQAEVVAKLRSVALGG